MRASGNRAMNDAGSMTPLAVYRRLLTYVTPHWRVFAGAVLAMGLFSLTEVGFLTLVRPLIDGSVVRAVRQDLFDHMLLLPVAFYERQRTGQLIARLTYNAEQVSAAVSSAMTSAIKGSLTTIGIIGYMFWLNWRLTLF